MDEDQIKELAEKIYYKSESALTLLEFQRIFLEEWQEAEEA